MKADTVAALGRSNADDGVGVVSNGEVDRLLYQSRDIVPEMRHRPLVYVFHVGAQLFETAVVDLSMSSTSAFLAEKWPAIPVLILG